MLYLTNAAVPPTMPVTLCKYKLTALALTTFALVVTFLYAPMLAATIECILFIAVLFYNPSPNSEEIPNQKV